VSFYGRRILPCLTHLAMRQRQLGTWRGRVVPAAEGRVLEVGIGSGLNLPFYADRVERVIGIDPSPELLAMARKTIAQAPVPVVLLHGSAEAMPLEDGSVDTVVTTWTLCTIPDAVRALVEMRRVLSPGGRLLFVEHGRAPEAAIRRWQDGLTPLWRRCAGGCHLNRPIDRLIEGAGFRIERLETGYAKGPKPMAFMYEGAARGA